MYTFHLFVKSILSYIALMHPKNWKYNRKSYPQLWDTWSWIAPKKSKRKNLLYFICGILTGHEVSETEWGYRGGNYIDRNCRWCDKVMREHKFEGKVPDGLEECADILGFNDRNN